MSDDLDDLAEEIELVTTAYGRYIASPVQYAPESLAKGAVAALAPKLRAGKQAERGERDPLEEQINRLATFIIDHVQGEPSQSQGAVDTAIRVMSEQAKRIEKLVLSRSEDKGYEQSLIDKLDTQHNRIAELEEIQLLAAPIVGKYDDALKRVAELEAALRRVLDLRPHLKQDLEAAEEGLAIFMVKFAKSRTLGDKLAKLLDESHQGGLYMSSPHNTQTCDTCVLLGRWAEEA